jgi:LysR family cys regulon transcriptional activator
MAGSNRYKQLELSLLRSFSTAALQRNFSAAAGQLGLSITTVWQQVRALEQRLGTTLLRAQGRTLQLTPEGRLLLELVQPHVSGLDSLERLFQARRAELPQHLTAASTYYLLSYHLPQSLQEFTARHPATRLNLRAGIWPEVTRLVEKGEADLGLVSYAEDAPRSPHLDYEPLFHLHFTLLLTEQHPLAQKRRIHPRDLIEYPLIMASKETFSYRTLERILNRHDLLDRIHVVLESPNTDMTRKYVGLGLGIALTYMGGEPEQPQPGLVQRVFDAKLEPLPVYLVVRKGAYLPEAVAEFRDIVRKSLGEGLSRD